jgi:hypothetical protein
MAILAGLSMQPAVDVPSSESGVALQHVMAELETLLGKDGFIDDELLDRLKALLPEDKQAEYHKLNQYILDTDYPQARSVLSSLMGK